MNGNRTGAATSTDNDRGCAEGSRKWRTRAWLLYLALVVPATGVYFLLPSATTQNPAYDLIGASAVAATVVGILTHRPRPSMPWWFFATGVLLFVSGDVIWTIYETVLGVASPFPSVADVLYLAGYPCFGAGLVLMIRNRAPGRQWQSVIDSFITITGVGMLSWTLLMEPYATSSKLSLLEELLSMAYPLMDLVLFTILLRLLFSGGRRPPAYYLLSTSLALLLIADTVYATRIVTGVYQTGDPLDAWWLLSYVALGASALHPSMVTVMEPAPYAETRLTLRRLMLLAAASLIIPGVLVTEAALGEQIDVHLIVAGSVALFAFVTARMALMIREHARTEEALREAEARYRTLVEQIPVITYVEELSARGKALTYMSPQYKAMLGYSPPRGASHQEHWLENIHPDDRERVLAEDARTDETLEPFETEYRVIAKDGRIVWMRDQAVVVRDERDRPLFWQGVMSDITERKVLEEQLATQALHDALTGLPNRALFVDRLKQALSRAERHSTEVAVLFIDLDNFKVINDSLGHEAGDELLVGVGKRLLRCLRPKDTPARLGGDEFVVLLEDIVDKTEAIRVAERIMGGLRPPFTLDGRQTFVSASIGIALSGPGQDRSTELLRDADAAMYKAKEDGNLRVFEPNMYVQAASRLELENSLRRALEHEEFEVYYQPQVNLQTGKAVGFETLVRWNHPERGMVSTSEFIPVAEETGLIVPLGWWVLKEACHQAKEWQQRYPSYPPLLMSVSLSAKQLKRPDAVETVERLLKETGLEPHCLSIDITETALITDPEDESIIALKRLRELGVWISIDDFGTEFSSLAYLKRLPADILKVDKSFVDGLGEAVEDIALVQLIVDTAHTLGMHVVAEGVQSAEQAEQLKEIGCDIAQGHHFSEPLPPEAAPAFLTDHGAVSHRTPAENS